MTKSRDRFFEDAKNLSDFGQRLHLSMRKDLFGEKALISQIGAKLGIEKAKTAISALPDFRSEYDTWYSEALSLVKFALPDRLANFISFYEKPRSRKLLDASNYVVQDYIQGIGRKDAFENEIVGPSAALSQFRQQLSIVEAARKRMDTSLHDITKILQSEIFDEELASARDLAKAKYPRAAGAMCGVLLEKHLLEVCQSHAIRITKKNPAISDLNELLKSNGVIDTPQWRHICLMADYRNICSHHKGVEPTATQINDLINGVEKIIATIS